MTDSTAATDSATTAYSAQPAADLVELRRLRIERSLIEAARDHYYDRWLADEELIGRLRLHVKHLEGQLSRLDPTAVTWRRDRLPGSESGG